MSQSAEERSRQADSPLSNPEFRNTLRELPPSAKLVAKVLDEGSTLTQRQITEESLLPARTVRYALNSLEDEGLVDARFCIEDARKRAYFLSE